jgi:hypothetical protein
LHFQCETLNLSILTNNQDGPFLDPRIQMNSDQSFRRALAPLQQLATSLECVVLMVRHLNKQSAHRARYRGSGSIGFQGAGRCGWLVGPDPMQPGRGVLAQIKNNLAPIQGSLAYAISYQPPADQGAGPGSYALQWLGSSELSADELLDAPANPGTASVQLEKGKRFLEEFLRPEPRLVRDIWEAGEAQGLSDRTLRRAKEDLKIRTLRVGKGREHRAYWCFEQQPLPADIPQDEVPPDLSPWLEPLLKAFPPPTPLEDD